MFGLPNTHPLSHVVHELTQTHLRTEGETTGQEPALLAMLEAAIKPSGETGGGVSGGKAGVPLDLSALTLWEDIKGSILSHWPGRYTDERASVPTMLQRWTSALAGSPDAAHLLEMCLYWHGAIRELFEPTKVIPVRGGHCPKCNASTVNVLQDGSIVRVPTLVARPKYGRVECLGCGTEWTEDGMVNLGAAAEFAEVEFVE